MKTGPWTDRGEQSEHGKRHQERDCIRDQESFRGAVAHNGWKNCGHGQQQKKKGVAMIEDRANTRVRDVHATMAGTLKPRRSSKDTKSASRRGSPRRPESTAAHGIKVVNKTIYGRLKAASRSWRRPASCQRTPGKSETGSNPATAKASDLQSESTLPIHEPTAQSENRQKQTESKKRCSRFVLSGKECKGRWLFSSSDVSCEAVFATASQGPSG